MQGNHAEQSLPGIDYRQKIVRAGQEALGDLLESCIFAQGRHRLQHQVGDRHFRGRADVRAFAFQFDAFAPQWFGINRFSMEAARDQRRDNTSDHERGHN